MHTRLTAAMMLVAATAAAGFAVAASPSPAKLPLGDYKYVTSGAKAGYVYLCNARKESNAGAFANGPWITGSTWDPTKKVTVDGSVAWRAASLTIKTSGTSRVITTNALPEHPSGTYPIKSTDDAYQYDRNPNSIKKQSISVTVPKDPVALSSPACMGGEVGVALTGVPIFNAFDAGLRDAVAHEVQDAYNGHPQEAGEYHYHNISDAVVKVLSSKDQSGPVLVGYAYDGFGIYGGTENGKTLTTADLDECHGHTSTIVWDGKRKRMYHYHVTADFPYTVSCFKGQPATTAPTGGQRQQGGGSATSAPGGMPQGGQQSGPPQEAMNACSGKSTGETCSFTDAHGSHAGTCMQPPGTSSLACAPAGGPPR